MKVEQGTYNGKPYRYVVVRKACIVSQKAGKLKLEPLIDELIVEVPSGKRTSLGVRL
jgi:hypothetical protein